MIIVCTSEHPAYAGKEAVADFEEEGRYVTEILVYGQPAQAIYPKTSWRKVEEVLIDSWLHNEDHK